MAQLALQYSALNQAALFKVALFRVTSDPFIKVASDWAQCRQQPL